MKLIKYIELYNYLTTEEDLNPIYACQSIMKIRQLPSDFKNAVLHVMEGLVPELECHNVTLQELIEKDMLTPIRAILILDWIRREPLVAMRYMEIERHKAPQEITESDKDKLKAAMERLNKQPEIKEAEDTSDISIE